MGKNGSGKSTLSKVLVGHPAYEVTGGSVSFKGRDLLELEPEARAHEGLFLSFQSPVEIPGVRCVRRAGALPACGGAATLTRRLCVRCARCAQQHRLPAPRLQRTPQGARHAGAGPPRVLRLSLPQGTLARTPLSVARPAAPRAAADAPRDAHQLEELKMDMRYLTRNVNEGFSGGEKKRNEILQLAVLDAEMAILDEIDSGLDIDALRDVAAAVNGLRKPERSVLMITHYQARAPRDARAARCSAPVLTRALLSHCRVVALQRLLDYIAPDFVHVMIDGRIVQTGGKARGPGWRAGARARVHAVHSAALRGALRPCGLSLTHCTRVCVMLRRSWRRSWS